MYKVYIDGSYGTTGLQIYDRLKNRKDIELLTIKSELKKDVKERSRLINSSDITFLCLPDEASIEALSLVTNPNTSIIDASTAHRTNIDFAYGLPDLGSDFKDKIINSKRVAVPGCYASGFLTILYPMVNKSIIGSDYPVVCSAISGYSGGGVKVIEQYQNSSDDTLKSPRLYATSQMHKHLKEMKYIAKLDYEPMFFPYISNHYSGMSVTIGFFTNLMKEKKTLEEIHAFYKEFYKDSKLIKVMPLSSENNFLAANHLSNLDYVNLYITGNDERISVTALFDNLGKGASGQAVLCMNLMLKIDELTALNL